MNTKSFTLIILVVIMSVLLYGCGHSGGGNGGGSSHSSSDSKGNNGNGGIVKNIAYYEGLCKQYLGQPQKTGLPIPDTYADAIEYLNQTLFFFPDDPKNMTEEQKDLYSAPCFWSGVKYRFAYNENSTTDADKIKGITPFVYYKNGGANGFANSGIKLNMPKFSEQRIQDTDREFNYYRYMIFTKQFYLFFVSQILLDDYCNNWWHAVNPNKPPFDCSDKYRMFTTRFIDDTSSYFISRDPNAQKGLRYSSHSVGSKSIDLIELYLMLRNLRFGSIDSKLMLSNVKDIDTMYYKTFAVSATGLRGNITISMDELRAKVDDGNVVHENEQLVTFKPEWTAIFTALKNYGEASFDIGRDSSNRVNEHYVSDYQLHDTERAELKNVTPKVIYFGIMPDYRVFFDSADPIEEYTVLHEVMHNMGFYHMMNYGRNLDAPYYISYIFNGLEFHFKTYTNFQNDLNNSVIKPYYHTTSQECIDYDTTSNAIVSCR